ncbi:thermonuclease family protein [Sphingomonas sp. LT1P40]|uniref:thermonuclease family protein n=1 Tax=Alteristakelama amylovorans TaxID=3096166 RepID=UPI002FCAD5D0
MLLSVLATAAVVPAGQSFGCTPVRVWDGDGPIWCEEGPRVRLAGIAAREMDGTCRANQPCPVATAVRSRDALAALLGRTTGRTREGHVLISGPRLTCQSVGSAGGKRTAAWCVSPVNGDISCAMVRGGFALRWARYWRCQDCNN